MWRCCRCETSEFRHDSSRTHLVSSSSGLLLGSRAPLVLQVLARIVRLHQSDPKALNQANELPSADISGHLELGILVWYGNILYYMTTKAATAIMHKWASVKYEGPSMRRVVQEHFLEMPLILTAHALFISFNCSKSVPRNLHQGCLLPGGPRGDCLRYQTNPRRGGSQFAQLFSVLVFKFDA